MANSLPRFAERASATYVPGRDLQEVEQFGFVNLAEAYEKGIVPSIVPSEDESFNGVQNPGTLMPRCLDVFDGIRKSEYVRSVLDKLNAEEREKAEARLATASAASGVTE